MWPPWSRTSPRIHHASPNPIFTHSSFKDIHLLTDSSHRIQLLSTIFHRVRLASSLLRKPPLSLLSTEHHIVVYYTSLRVVRRTFDACKSVQSILHAFPVAIDERDVSVYPPFLDELREIIGKEKITLPKVFIGGRLIGGAEEVWQMYETGELKKLVEEVPATKPRVCDECGGFRFVVCGDCNGSHKVYSGKLGFRSCPACSEDGLIKCPSCYPTALLAR